MSKHALISLSPGKWNAENRKCQNHANAIFFHKNFGKGTPCIAASKHASTGSRLYHHRGKAYQGAWPSLKMVKAAQCPAKVSRRSGNSRRLLQTKKPQPGYKVNGKPCACGDKSNDCSRIKLKDVTGTFTDITACHTDKLVSKCDFHVFADNARQLQEEKYNSLTKMPNKKLQNQIFARTSVCEKFDSVGKDMRLV